jgi:hypothetical protein
MKLSPFAARHGPMHRHNQGSIMNPPAPPVKRQLFARGTTYNTNVNDRNNDNQDEPGLKRAHTSKDQDHIMNVTSEIGTNHSK